MKSMWFCLMLIIGAAPALASDEVWVIANLENKATNLSRQEIRNLFMGDALTYNLTAVALPPQHLTRVLFNTKVIGLTESRIQSYWAQMRFSGRKKPPLELANEVSILEYIQANPGTVGYVSAQTPIPEQLTVLFRSQ
ncbi:hypothetical protein [Paraglaciecola aestuariivivens]